MSFERARHARLTGVGACLSADPGVRALHERQRKGITAGAERLPASFGNEAQRHQLARSVVEAYLASVVADEITHRGVRPA